MSAMDDRPFSHVADYTEYMAAVRALLAAGPRHRRVLDVPAGGGRLADALRADGFEVVCADINRAREDYVYADMGEPLPFADGSFDVACCLEGLEHLIEPVPLIRELVRVTRHGGEIVVSTPNVANFYSRLAFLFTGAFYQFNPAAVPAVAQGEARDRGHITPLNLYQLEYLFLHHGASLKQVAGDRWKKKALLPLYALLLPFVWLATRRTFRRNPALGAWGLAPAALFARSLVLVFEKR